MSRLSLAALVAALVLADPAAAAQPKVPTWVRTGLSVPYMAYSAAVQNGRFVNGIVVDMKDTVTGTGGGLVTGVTQLQTQGDPEVTTYRWACNAAGSCRGGDWQFWVDPANPTGSIRGPDGEIFTVLGREAYTDPWHRVWNATILNYEDPANGVRFTVAYQTGSGLILYSVQSYPSQYTAAYYD